MSVITDIFQPLSQSSSVYKMSKQTARMRKWTTHCYRGCLRHLTCSL